MRRGSHKTVVWLSLVFVLFAAGAVMSALFSARSWKVEAMRARLEGYADLVGRGDTLLLSSGMLSDGLRITVLSLAGDVLYDSDAAATALENHLLRPEIVRCVESGSGWSVRASDTAHKKYFYYAKRYDDRIVRVAQLFEVRLERFFRPDWMLMLVVLLLMALALAALALLAVGYERRESARNEEERRLLKHEMTGNISHELKTPVSRICGYLETVVNHPELPEERRRTYVERSWVQSVKLSDMIRDISLITKLEETPEQFKVEPVDLKRVAGEVIEEMHVGIAEAGMSVCDELPPVSIRANEGLLYAIFRNLMENAVKYAGHGCTVRISHAGGGRGVHVVEFTDNGQGVPSRDLDRIFERFYRLDTDRNRDGSGLGLSIVRNAVLFHRGEITAFHASGGGLGFRFTLRDLP